MKDSAMFCLLASVIVWSTTPGNDPIIHTVMSAVWALLAIIFLLLRDKK